MKHIVLEIVATILVIVTLSSCEEKNITLEDLSGPSTNITLTCTPKNLTLGVGEVADIVVEVSGARKESSVSCLSSNPDVAIRSRRKDREGEGRIRRKGCCVGIL